ncbi:unnamed protein product, partial [Allacma fusca]
MDRDGKRVLGIFRLAAISQLIFSSQAADMNDYTRLRQDLKTGYDPNARPSQHHSNATILEFSIISRGLQFNEAESLFTLNAWPVLGWNDDHMKWDPARYGNITTMHFATNEVWKPDISVYNNYDSDIDHFKNARIIAYSTGNLLWVPPATFKVRCVANLRRWPYDTQTCQIVLGSWAHSGEELDLRLPTNFTKVEEWEFSENREWKLVSDTITRRVNYYACCPNSPYYDIVMTLTIQRHSSSHTAAVVVPALAIAVAILISFWIRPIATERLAIIMLVILINCTYLYNVYSMVPSNGDNVPLVLLYFRDSLLMVSVALVWTIGLRYLAAAKRTSPVPLPGFIQVFLDSWVSKGAFPM